MIEVGNDNFGDQSWEAWKGVDPEDMRCPVATQRVDGVMGSVAVGKQGIVVPYTGSESAGDLPHETGQVDKWMEGMMP